MTAAKRPRRGGPRLGAGRPAGPAESVRRHRTTVLLTDAEQAELEALAAERQLPPGTVVYQIVRRALARRRGGA